MTEPESRSIGSFIRQQRQLAQLSLREMAKLSSVSNAYLSQVERGLHEPSVRVLHAVADALSIPVEELVAQGGPERDERPGGEVDVEAAIRADRRLSAAQKEALLAVYRSYVASSAAGADEED